MTQLYDPPADVPLGYATPAGGGPSPVWAGFWVLAGGLALVLLGGCFCVGLLLLVTDAPNAGLKSVPHAWTARHTALMLALYAAALACFAAGATLVVMATRKLLAVGRP